MIKALIIGVGILCINAIVDKVRLMDLSMRVEQLEKGEG